MFYVKLGIIKDLLVIKVLLFFIFISIDSNLNFLQVNFLEFVFGILIIILKKEYNFLKVFFFFLINLDIY